MSDPTTTDADSFEARVFPFGRSEADSMAGYPKPTTTDAPRDLLALVRAAIAECESRLKVCEAQTPGPYRTVFAVPGQDRDVGIIAPECVAVLAECFEEYVARGDRRPDSAEANARAIAAQRTQRPQELRARIATLRKIEKAVPWGLTAFVEDLLDGIVRELGVRP